MYNSDDLLKIIWEYMKVESDLPSTAAAIVIGGSGRDMGMATRAAEIYKSGIASTVVVSGWCPPGDTSGRTEAENLAKACELNGIPANHIWQDQKATNTGENITRSAELLKSRIAPIESVILIHKPYMSRRFIATAEAQWPQPQPNFYVTYEHIDFENYCKREGKDEVIRKMLGDFKRIKPYAEQGFQSPQPIPKHVQIAFDALIDIGIATQQ